jgi:hypothetical protein
VAAAGHGVGPQDHLGLPQPPQRYPADGTRRRQQAHAQACHDHLLHQVEAVRAVRDARLEAGQRGDDADYLLVGGVARVHDPVLVPVLAEHLGRLAPRPVSR